MKSQEAINILEKYKSVPKSEIVKTAYDIAISALEKQIEIEKAQFTHICKSDSDLYPTTFSIYARLIEENEDSITIDRFQKFGALPLGQITISKKDFERYYRKIDKKE